MKKKFLSMIIAIVMVVTIISGTALTASAATTTGITGECTWTFDDSTGTLTISGEGAVGSDQSWIEHVDSITSIVIEDGITSIGTNAFRNISSLESVTLSASVSTIGNTAFYRCSSLETVNYLGKSAPSMGTNVFMGSGLMVVNVPVDYEGDTFGDRDVVKNLVEEPSAPEAEQYFVTFYWGIDYTEELGYIVDKAPMVYDEARGLYTYTVEDAVLKGDGLISAKVYASDKNTVISGVYTGVQLDAYGFSADVSFQPELEIYGLKFGEIRPTAPPEWRNGHVVVLDSNNDIILGKSDQYIQLIPDNGVHTATVENMDAYDGNFFLLIDGVIAGVESITILNDGSTVVFTSDGNVFDYTIVDSETPEPTPTYVAEVNGTSYETLADAISAAKATEDSTLKLLADVTEIIMIDGGTFTLDLNGYSVGGDDFMAFGVYAGEVTIIDSSENKTGSLVGDEYGVYVSGGKVTISGGTINSGYRGVNILNGELNITGGTINGDYHSVYVTGGSVSITGGTINSSFEGVYVDGGTVSIAGGIFNGYYDGVEVASGSAVITGGSFGTKPTAYLAEGYVATLNSETNLYDVAEESAPEITGVAWNDADGDGEVDADEAQYETIYAAIAAAQENEGFVLKLLENIALDATETGIGIEITGGTFTLDLNGHSISNAVLSCILSIGNDANITIADSSADKTGVIAGGTVYAVSVANGGTLSITGGKIRGGNSDVKVLPGGTCQISGGSFNTDPSEFVTESYVATLNNETGMYEVAINPNAPPTNAELEEMIEKLIADLEVTMAELDHAIESKADAEDIAAAIKNVTDIIAALDETYATDAAIADAIAAAKTEITKAYEEALKNEIQDLEDAIAAQVDPDELADAIKNVTDIIAALDETYATDAAIADAIAAAKTEITKAYEEVLKNEIQDLEDAIAAQVDPDELADAIKNVTDIIAALDETYATDAAIADAISKAETDLATAVAALEDHIAKEIEKLQNQIGTNDADFEAINESIGAINALIDALKKADEALDGDISDAVTKAENELKAAQDELKKLIGDVQTNLDNAKAELDKVIADLDAAVKAGDKSLSDEIAALNTALENAKATLAKADADNKAELVSKIEAADATLDAAIKAVQKNLDDVKTALNKAIADGDTALDGKIAALNEALATAKAALEAADTANKTALMTKIDEADVSLDAAIKAVQKNLNDLKAVLEAKDNELAKADAENMAALEEKDAELQTIIILACVISGVALCGSGAFVVWFFLDRKKRI